MTNQKPQDAVLTEQPDIVERLREWADGSGDGPPNIAEEAADEIEFLRSSANFYQREAASLDRVGLERLREIERLRKDVAWQEAECNRLKTRKRSLPPESSL
jgi:hypothetical protein